MTSEDMYGLINAARDLMLEEARNLLWESDCEHLPGLIRITERFNAEICEDPPIPEAHDALYNQDTILYAVDSYVALKHAYRRLGGRIQLSWDHLNRAQVIHEFKAIHPVYHQETHFGRKLGLLLNLFRLQIIWAVLIRDLNERSL